MTEEKRLHKKSNKKKFIIFGFIGILVVSMMLGGLLSSNYQQPSNSAYVISYNPYDVFSTVIPQCYITYIDQNNTNDNRATVILYGETKNAIEQVMPGINMTKLLSLEGTKLYLFQHCKFFNDRGTKLPDKFNDTLGTTLPGAVQQEIFQEVQMDQSTKTPIADFAKTNSIESIGKYYFLSYEDAAQILLNQKIITLKDDCMPYGFAINSTEYMCVWNGSSFMYDSKHHDIQPFQYDQRITSLSKLKELSSIAKNDKSA